MWANLEFEYTDMYEISSHVESFGGDVYDLSGEARPNGERSFAASFRANGALVAPGTLFTTKLLLRQLNIDKKQNRSNLVIIVQFRMLEIRLYMLRIRSEIIHKLIGTEL